MPHLKRVFHCGRLKRDNTSAIQMLHQMSVGVVVVALALVLIFLILFFAAQNPLLAPF